MAAAAVRGVAEGSVGGGRARHGAHDSAGGAAGFEVPVRRFVSATLAGEVAAHPLHYLFHHLIFKLEKTLIRLLNVGVNPERTIPRERVKVHLFHVRSEPHGGWLVFGFAALGVLDRNLRRNTSEFSQISAKSCCLHRLILLRPNIFKNRQQSQRTVNRDAAS